jgi:ElaB/YqjD/DUF883 family membrane-anchored ribosome-binding protein
MTNKATNFMENVADEASAFGEKLSDTAAQVKDKVSDFGHSAANKIDENRDAAASGFQKAASALHENAGSLPGGEKVSGLAHDAARKLSSTAVYVREHDVNSMIADFKTLVKNNPGPSLIAAAVIGFLVGRAVSSDDKG